MAPSAQPALIGLDWGTSSLRGHLIAADGSVLESVAQPWGIQHLPAGGFKAAFGGVAGAWRDRWPELPAVAAGMVGSRQGWREAAYVECPADAGTIARGLLRFETGAGSLHIVPGVIQRGVLPNVLRGEEMQVLGALVREPALAAESLIVLPGTHSKWVTVKDGRLARFETFMTGELYAVLREHSLLGVPAREAPAVDAAAREVAFARGLEVARESGPAGLSGRLFTTRSLFLTGDLPAAATLDYLSGLLVGEEIRSAVAGLGGTSWPALVLVGGEELCDRYRRALTGCGIERVRVCGDTAAAGLWQIAKAAGLVSAARDLFGNATHG